MAIKIGNNSINKAYIGNGEINKMYLGNDIVFDNSVRPFIIEVNLPSGVGSTSSFQFTGAVGDYDVVAKQSGSIVQTFNNLSDESTINLNNGGGVYILEVKPKASNGFNRIEFDDGVNKNEITDIKQFGDIVWSSFENAFKRCININVNANDAPNLTQATSLSQMFRGASSFNNNINFWNVSNITNMEIMFGETDSFNQPLNNWNVGNVTNMRGMFGFTDSFNQPLNNWNVGSATNMIEMFRNALSFNRDLSGWCVTNIASEPSLFDTNADAWVLPNSRPIWGTCP